MQISSNDLINLPVYTEGGRNLGRVISIDIDIDSNTITHYHVRTGLIKGFWHQELLIHKSQVVSINQEKMVVEDNVSKQPETGLQEATLAGQVK